VTGDLRLIGLNPLIKGVAVKAVLFAVALALATAAAAPAPAAASSVSLSGVRMPARVVVDGTPLYLNGAGVHAVTLFKVDVYVAALYLSQRTASAERILASSAPKQLSLLFKRNVSREELLRAVGGLEGRAGGPGLERRIAELTRALTDIARGDVLTFTFTPEIVEVRLNGRLRGQVADRAFANALLSAWLGPNPVSDSLKEGLLGRL
jgi:hypothetical protein